MPWEEDTVKVDEVRLLDVEGLVVIISRFGASIRLASLGRLRLQAFECSNKAQSVRLGQSSPVPQVSQKPVFHFAAS